MTLGSAIARFRQAEAKLMADSTGTLRRPNGTTFNPSTGVSTPTAITVYSGVGYVRPAPGPGASTVSGDDQVQVGGFVGKFPPATDARKDDVWTQTTSRDGLLVGRSFRVERVLVDEWEITRRVALEEVVT